VPDGVLLTVAVLVVFVVVRVGKHCAPIEAPGIEAAVVVPLVPFVPAVAP
jgi:hypothetical protein